MNLKTLQAAADQGLAAAQCNLGDMYADGRGVAKDEARAAELYQAAADQGHAGAQYNLGFSYANGRGVAKDEARAVQLFEVGYVAWGGERWHATVRPPVAGGAPVLHAAKAGESVRPTELVLYERHGQRWQAQWLHGFFVSVPSGGAAAGGGGAGAPRPTIGRTLRYEDWGGEAKVWRPEAGAEGKAAG